MSDRRKLSNIVLHTILMFNSYPFHGKGDLKGLENPLLLFLPLAQSCLDLQATSCFR